MAALCACFLAKSGRYSFCPLASLGCSNVSTGLKGEKHLIIYNCYHAWWQWQFWVVVFLFGVFFLAFFLGGGGGPQITYFKKEDKKRTKPFSFYDTCTQNFYILFTCCRDRLNLLNWIKTWRALEACMPIFNFRHSGVKKYKSRVNKKSNLLAVHDRFTFL